MQASRRSLAPTRPGVTTDNDGDLDLAVVALSGGPGGTSIVYRNDGAGSGADDWNFKEEYYEFWIKKLV